MSIPEPKSFNGDPGETGRYVNRNTGRRAEEPEPPSLRGTACYTCGKTIHRVYTLADVGAFCSPKCRDEASEPKDERRSA